MENTICTCEEENPIYKLLVLPLMVDYVLHNVCRNKSCPKYLLLQVSNIEE